MTRKSNDARKGAPEKVVGTNPLTLPWPQDPQGALSALKAGGLVAARRVNGDKAKYDKLIETLKIIAGHANARFEMDTKARETAKLNHVSAKLRTVESQRVAAEAKAKEYEAAALRVRERAGVLPAETPEDAAE